jgi:predicted DNA-binding WGR domain protein
MAKREREEGDELGGRWVAPSVSGGKFWAISVEGASVTTSWGKVGTEGQSKTKEFKSSEQAMAVAKKTIAEKEKGGYEKEEEGGEGAEEGGEEGGEGEGEEEMDLKERIVSLLEFDDKDGRTPVKDSVKDLAPIEEGRPSTLSGATVRWGRPRRSASRATG